MSSADEFAAGFMADLRIADHNEERQQQTENRIVGVSDLQHCESYLVRFLSGEPFTDTPEGSQARAGTFYHAGVLPAIAAARPGSLIEQELTVTLTNGYKVVGHADLIEPDEPSVTDVKTVDTDMALVRRTGASQQQIAQRHLYYAGAHQAGIVPAAGTVRNIWLDRSGTPSPPHVQQEPYNPHHLAAAADWLDGVLDHVDAGTEGSRDKDFHFCEKFCRFFTACRGEYKVPQDTVESDELSVAAALYVEGAEAEKGGKELRLAAGSILSRAQGERLTIVGSDGSRHSYASTWIAASESRAGHYRATVKPLAS